MSQQMNELIDTARRNPPKLDSVRRARVEDSLVSKHVASSRSTQRSFGKWALAATLSFCALVGMVAYRSGEVRGPVALTDETTRALPRSINVGHASLHFDERARGVVYKLSDVDGEARVDQGRIEVEFHPKVRGAEHFEVRTHAALISVVGTVFWVSVDAEQNVEVGVKDGRVKVASLFQERSVVFVSGGERVHVDGAGRVGAVARIEIENAVIQVPSSPRVPSLTPVPAAAITPAPDAAPTRLEETTLAPSTELEESATHSKRVPRIRETSLPPSTAAESLAPEDLMRRGDVARRAGRFDEAETAYAEARSKSRTHGTEWFNALFSIAKVARARGDKPRALALYREYVALGGPLADLANVELCALGECAGEGDANAPSQVPVGP